jgi:hypothetical protein
MTKVMEKKALEYQAPAMRVVETRMDLCFLRSGGEGNIDPGTDDPWGDF